MKQKYVLLLAMLLTVASSFAQLEKIFLKADSLESGNAKDMVTNFFQLALDNLIGKEKEFKFNATPYALILKHNANASIDSNYKKLRPLRKLNIGFGVKLDSSFSFNGFTSGLRYALVDKTDITVSRIFSVRAKTDKLRNERDLLRNYLAQTSGKMYHNIPNKIDKPQEKDSSSAEFLALKKFLDNKQMLGDVPFKDLDTGFQKQVLDIVNNDDRFTKIKDVFENKKDSSFKDIELRQYEALKTSMKDNFLWTVGISDTTYKDRFQFSSIALVSELTKGLSKPRRGANDIEFNARAAYVFSNDTLGRKKNLNRKTFSFESGFNWVVRDGESDRSFFELKFTGALYRNMANLYAGEKRNYLTLNLTPRFRLVDDIWIPLQIKYDPENGAMYCLLDIKANFTGLINWVKQSAKK